MASSAAREHHRNTIDGHNVNPYFVSARNAVQHEELILNNMRTDLMAATVDKLLEGHTERLLARLVDLLTQFFMTPSAEDAYHGYGYPYAPYPDHSHLIPQHPEADSISLDLPLKKKKRRPRKAPAEPQPRTEDVAMTTETNGSKSAEEESVDEVDSGLGRSMPVI